MTAGGTLRGTQNTKNEADQKPNIERLTAYINSQPDPERFMLALFSLIKPCPDDLSCGQKEPQILVG